MQTGFFFLIFIPLWLFPCCGLKTFIAPSCWKAEKSTGVIPDNAGSEAESTHFSLLNSSMDCYISGETVDIHNFCFCGLAFSSSSFLTCDLKQALARKENSSSSFLNLPIILSKRRNAEYSVILLATQMSVISS